MSYNPPGGPPPPYGYHPHRPAHTPGYTYVPTPVVMPMPVAMPMPVYPPPSSQPQVDPGFSQPTYVTNHYYQTQPEQVQVANPQPPPMRDPIEWVPCDPHRATSFSHRAVVGGKEGYDGSPLLVIRAHHSGELIPGKLAVKHRGAYVPYNGNEIPVHNFELLCAPAHAVQWVPSNNGTVPQGAIAAGNTHNGEVLYIGRGKHMRSLTPGKVHQSHGCLYISYGHKEIPIKNYEVLCRTNHHMLR